FDDVPMQSSVGLEEIVKSYWEVWWASTRPQPQLVVTSNNPRLKEWAQSRMKRVDLLVHFPPDPKHNRRLSELFEFDNRLFEWFSSEYLKRWKGEVSQEDELALARELEGTLPVVVFPGDPEAPDAVFPNNVFATARGKLLVGRMRHEVRRREATNAAVRRHFEERLGYATVDLSQRDDLVAELTGPLVVDHARAIGYCGLSGRCDRRGAAAMHELFGLALTFVFELGSDEYHTNVVTSVLAGRALLIHEGSFVDPEVPRAIASVYGERVLRLSDAEKCAFAGNCLALGEDEVWMSTRAEAALRAESRRALESWGFTIRSVPLDEIEKAGGSLRCCVTEIF
ncbi:MAG: arginine deiminase-related protein, partial [Myxococcota bacterium]